MGEPNKPLFEIKVKTTHRDLRGNVSGESISRTTDNNWTELEDWFIKHLRGAGFSIPLNYEEWEKYDPDSDEAQRERDEEEKKEEFLERHGYYGEPTRNFDVTDDPHEGDTEEDEDLEPRQSLKDLLKTAQVRYYGNWVNDDY